MTIVLRPSEKNRRQAPWLVLAFLGFFLFGVLSMWYGAAASTRLVGAICMGVFWGAWLLLAIYSWRYCWVHELRLDEESIDSVGVFVEKSLRWEEIAKCRWCLGTSFSIRLKTPNTGLWVHRDNYQREDLLTTVRVIRELVPEEKQRGWDSFISSVDLTAEDLQSSANTRGGP